MFPDFKTARDLAIVKEYKECPTEATIAGLAALYGLNKISIRIILLRMSKG